MMNYVISLNWLDVADLGIKHSGLPLNLLSFLWYLILWLKLDILQKLFELGLVPILFLFPLPSVENRRPICFTDVVHALEWFQIEVDIIIPSIVIREAPFAPLGLAKFD